ncbi:MAG: hypothetical protein IT437_07260 [Phycisphaerales bacterium]|nr:hypothetical protein [Phycisphaerales bacterium]
MRRLTTLRGRIAVCYGAAVLATPLCAFAQTADSGFNKWWSLLTSGGAAGPSTDGFRLDYRVEYLSVPTDTELSKLRREVAGHPEHPQYSRLQQYEKRLAGKEVTEKSVWRLNGLWRISQSWPESPLPYWDFVWGSSSAWQLTPARLTLFSEDASSEAGDTHARNSGSMNYEVGLLLTGGVMGAVANSMDLRPVLDRPDHWTVAATLVRDQDSIRYSAEGDWDAAAARGTVTASSFEVLDRAGRVTAASTCSAPGWETVSGLDLAVARRAIVSGMDGRPDRAIVFVAAAPFTAREFEELTTPPSAGGNDPVRGAASFTSVLDLRGPEQREASVLNNTLQWNTTTSDAPRRILQWSGWALLAFLALTFVLIRARRAARAS